MAIIIKNLSKKYYKSNLPVLDQINAVIPEGIFGLIGENGAGKSSLLKILATVAPFQKGEVVIGGLDLAKDTDEIRRNLGYLPQKFDFFERLSVYEMLDYVAMLKGIDEKERENDILHMIDEFNLNEKIHTRISKLSGGMKQRLAIAQALLGSPGYIIMDEPTVGLDPGERLRFRNIISKRRNKSNIIISTHIISDIAVLCENVGIMKSGKLIYSGSIDTLLERVERKIYVDNIPLESGIDIDKYKNIISVLRKKDSIEIRFIAEHELSSQYKTVPPTLEDAYFYISNIEVKD